MPPEPTAVSAPPGGGAVALSRRLGLFDATMIVMGGIIGSGIFINPSVVARQVHTPLRILGVWAAGGAIALVGAFIYAELASRRPEVGGQYAYLREAFHPFVAFAYGWGLLLVVQTGGMAAGAVAAARYLRELTGMPLADWTLAALALSLLTLINCLGVRSGATTQSVLMVAKILAIGALIVFGLFAPRAAAAAAAQANDGSSFALLTAMAAAMVPVLFAFGGWQTATFVSGEIREPRRNLPRALLYGVGAVLTLYLLVNFVCLRVLGPAGLAASQAPASDVMRAALGEPGARIIAVAIAVSTLGFLSQSMLTAPRVYYAMAQDGLFFRSVGWVHRGTRAPAVAIALQGVLAIVIAVSGRYDQILNYVVSVDWIFFGLTAAALFVFRARERRAPGEASGFASGDAAPGGVASSAIPPSEGFRVPGHPVTTGLFVAVSFVIVATTLYEYPAHAATAIGILLAAVPAYLLWHRRRAA